MNDKALKSGNTFVYLDNDNIYELEVWYDNDSPHSWQNGYMARFNGNYYFYKTYKALEKKVTFLRVQYELVFEQELTPEEAGK